MTAILDVEFGRLQARDMLQHLWTGPISNASLDVIQGARSVEVRAVGVTKVCILVIPNNLFDYRVSFWNVCLPSYNYLHRVQQLIVF